MRKRQKPESILMAEDRMIAYYIEEDLFLAKMVQCIEEDILKFKANPNKSITKQLWKYVYKIKNRQKLLRIKAQSSLPQGGQES